MRALLVAALLLVGCQGCQQPQPTPVIPTTAPPPVMADAGSPCASACEAAAALCSPTAMPIPECSARCTEGTRQLSGGSAQPRCLAAELMCSRKDWCTP